MLKIVNENVLALFSTVNRNDMNQLGLTGTVRYSGRLCVALLVQLLCPACIF